MSDVREYTPDRLIVKYEGSPKVWMAPFRSEDDPSRGDAAIAVLRLMAEAEENQK